MTRVNIRALIILVVGLLVAGAGVHWLHGYQVQRNAVVFLEAAEAAKQSGDLPGAVRNLEWYVSLVPNDADVLADLGFLFADASAPVSAYSTFEATLRIDPLRSDVRRRLVKVALQLERFTDAREHLQDHLLKEAPEDAELLYLLGACQESLRELEPAVASYRKAIQNDPGNLDAYWRLAFVLRRNLDRPLEADEVIDKMVQTNADSCGAHVLRGQYLRTNATAEELRNGTIDEVLKETTLALKISPDDADALHLAAQCELAREDFDKARQYAQRAVDLYPARIGLLATLADIELRAGNRERAMAVLRQGLKKNPQALDLLWNLAMLLVNKEQEGEAAEILARLKALRYTPALVGYLEGRIELLRGHWLSASYLLEGFRAELTGWPDLVKQADFCAGRCYAELGEPDLQLTAYRRAASVDPRWVPPRVGIAKALIAMGRLEEAFHEYRQIVKLGTAPKNSHLQLARLGTLRNLGRDPEDRDWRQVEQFLDQAEKTSPDEVAIPILRAEVLFAQNRVPETEQLLLAARDRQPDKLELRVALIALADRQNERDKAEKHLEEAQEKFKGELLLLLARAQHYAKELGDDARPKLRQLIEAPQDFDDQQQRRFWTGMATISIEIGDYQQARWLYEQISKKRPNHLGTRIILFDLALRAGDKSGLKGQLDEIHSITGKSPLWLYANAVHLTLLAEDGQKGARQKALKCLAEARVVRPDWSRLPLLAARLHDAQGEQDLAIEEYIQAIDLGARNPMAIRRVVDLLCQRRRYLEADRIIRHLEEQVTPFSSQISRVASEVALQLADFERAQRMARRAAARSDDYRDHIWLGRVLAILGQQAKSRQRDDEATSLFREAEQEMRRAIELSEKSAVAWLALVQFLERSGKHEQAQLAILNAEQKIDPDEAPLAVAQCYDAVGQFDKAEGKYERALADAPDDAVVVRQVAGFYLRAGKPDRAEPLLESIAGGKLHADRGDVVWARRSMATVLLARGGFRNLQKALALVDKNLRTDAISLRDQRAKVLLLASYPGRPQRREAILTLEDYLETQQSATPEERFLLAKLYLSVNDWANFRRHMLRVLATHKKDADYVAFYVNALLNRKDTVEAALWLDRLEELAPNKLVTLTLKSSLAVNKGKPEKAMEAVKAYVAASEPDTRVIRESMAAGVLEQLGFRLKGAGNESSAQSFFKEAEATYREVAARKPETELLLVPFLARQSRIDEALDLAEDAWLKAKPDTIALALSPILSGVMNPSDAQLDRGEKILRTALAKHNRSPQLLLMLGDLCTLRQRSEEAETIYREVLRSLPKNVGAMNNLTMILVTHKKDLAEAEQIINRAVTIAGPQPSLLDTRAAVYLALNEPQNAVNDLRHALAEAPSPILYFHLAQAEHQLGRSNEARNALKEGYKLGLTPATLHPLERASFRELRAALR